jgi:hypothetical protein
MTFYSESATINDQNKKIIFIYENDQKEIGVCVGNVLKDAPETFFMQYFDIASSDMNMDKEGRIDFSREPFTEQAELKAKGDDSWYLGKE